MSFLVPTAGRLELEVCLASISQQLDKNDEVIVIADTTDGRLPESQKITQSFGDQFRYLEYDAGYHAYGHPQINYGITQARGDFLHVSDDDDIWLRGAVDVIRQIADESQGKISLVRFRSYHGHLIWSEKGRFQQDYLGGHCMVCRNIPEKVAQWTNRYQGDYDWLESTVNLNGGVSEIIWRDEIVCYARPDRDMQLSILKAAGRHNSPLLSTYR